MSTNMHTRQSILYIEDNADNQRLVRRILESRGYTVTLANDGPHGIALARESRPAMILVDINIPGLDGYETTTLLRNMEHLRGVPVVAVTADSRVGARERSLVAGCDGYITKPIDPHRLTDQLQEFLAGKREELPQDSEAPLLREYTSKLVERLERQVRDLTAANAELQELDQLKSQFLATLSHELRTPLTSILGYLDLFQRGTLGSLSEVQDQALDVMTRNAQTLARQLNNLLYLQEVRSSQIKRVPISVYDMLLRLTVESRKRAEEQGLRFDMALQPALPFYGDTMALDQAFRNLLDNAIKFTPRGGYVRVALDDDPSRLILRVEDSGIGIPAEAQAKIFVPFYQVDASLARPHPGAGLGLAIVKHVIEAHNGHVAVRSAPGSGSTFTVVLPRN
jgi:signal transduction histidine kinase